MSYVFKDGKAVPVGVLDEFGRYINDQTGKAPDMVRPPVRNAPPPPPPSPVTVEVVPDVLSPEAGNFTPAPAPASDPDSGWTPPTGPPPMPAPVREAFENLDAILKDHVLHCVADEVAAQTRHQELMAALAANAKISQAVLEILRQAAARKR